MISLKKIFTKILQALSSLQTSVSNIQTSITTTYATATPGSATSVQNANQKRCYLVKTGKSVRCYCGIGYADGSTTIGSGITLFTIPSGYRPKATKIFPAVGYRAIGRTIAANLVYNTDGTITQTSAQDCVAITGCAEWETD